MIKKYNERVYAIITNKMFKAIQRQTKYTSSASLLRIAISEFLEKWDWKKEPIKLYERQGIYYNKVIFTTVDDKMHKKIERQRNNFSISILVRFALSQYLDNIMQKHIKNDFMDNFIAYQK